MLLKQLTLHSSLEKNLHLMALARLILCLLAQLFVLLNVWLLGVEISLLLAEGCLALLAGSAALTFYQLASFKRKAAPQNLERQVRIQLISDVLLLTLLFHFTGGAANPFVSILLFPLIISASILPGRFSWFMVVLTLSCYGSLFWSDTFFGNAMRDQAVAGHAHAGHDMQHQTHSEDSAFSLHIIGMWFNFAISAVLISFFVVKMRQGIDKQQQKINQQREQALRDEQLLGITAQAASAAHHMGTPLATMSVIIHDLQSEQAVLPAFQSDLSVLADQVENCKQILKHLRTQAETRTEEESIREFLLRLIEEFHLLRPRTRLMVEGDNCLPAGLKMPVDPALRMAILNILNNAADASPDQVRLQSGLDTHKLILTITDSGSGFASQTEFLPIASAKHDGLGLGLFLSHATINRVGGDIQIQPLSEGGTCVRISLPLEEQL